MTEESLQQLKKSAEEAGSSPVTTILVFADELTELIQRVEHAEKKVVWLERKKRTISDLARAAHNWSKAKLELADKRILHIEEVLEAGNGAYNYLTDDTEFKRGYRAALHWFRNEILDDVLFTEERKDASVIEN